MSSAEVDYGAGYKIKNPEAPHSSSPGEGGENHFEATVSNSKMDDEPMVMKSESLFKLSGVDFVTEGEFVFGRPEEAERDPASKDLSLAPEFLVKPETGKTDERPENETGDGLQQLQQATEFQSPEAEKTCVNETEPDKPVVRKQFKNFRLNEKILGKISSEKSKPTEKDQQLEPEPPIVPYRPNHLLFNGARSGRFYTLTFSRDENAEVIREAKSDVFENKQRYMNCYALNSNQTVLPSIYDDADVDMPLSQLSPMPPVTGYDPDVIPGEQHTHSTTRVLEEPGSLKIYKTHSNLTMDEPLQPMEPVTSNACDRSNTSCVTSDTDVHVEDELKTVEPLSSGSSADNVMTVKEMRSLKEMLSLKEIESLKEMDLEPTAVIVIGNTGCVDENMPSEFNLSARPVFTDSRRTHAVTMTSRSREPELGGNLQVPPSEAYQGMSSGGSRLGHNGSRKSGGRDIDSWGDEESITVDISRKNSFVSIDLDPDSTLRISNIPGDLRQVTGDYASNRHQETLKTGVLSPDSKKNQSRLLKVKRKIKTICEKVKHNVIKKK